MWYKCQFRAVSPSRGHVQTLWCYHLSWDSTQILNLQIWLGKITSFLEMLWFSFAKGAMLHKNAVPTTKLLWPRRETKYQNSINCSLYAPCCHFWGYTVHENTQKEQWFHLSWYHHLKMVGGDRKVRRNSGTAVKHCHTSFEKKRGMRARSVACTVVDNRSASYGKRIKIQVLTLSNQII